MKEINLKEILEESLGENVEYTEDVILNAMKEACKKVLDITAEEATAYISINDKVLANKVGEYKAEVSKASILKIKERL